MGLGAILDFQSRDAVKNMNKAQAGTFRLQTGLQNAGIAARTAAGTIAKFGLALVPVGAALGVGVKKALDWETGMARIGTLLTGPDLERLPQISREMGELTRQYGVAASTMQEGMFQAISASVPATKSMEFMTVAAKAAVGGFTDMNVAVDGLTNVINAYGLSVDRAEEVASAFFVSNRFGKTTFDELAQSLGQVSPLAAKLDVDFRQLSAVIAGVSKQGIVTAEVVTGLRAAFTNLMQQQPRAIKMAKKIGIEWGVAGMKAAGGFVPFLEEITRKAKGNVSVMQRMFRSVEGLKVVLALTSKVGMATYTQSMEDMATRSVQLQEAFAKVEQKTKHQLRRLGANFSSLAKDVGTELLPVVREAANALGDMVDTLRANPRELRGAMRSLATGLRSALQTAKKTMGWLRDNLETILAVSKQLVSTWIKFKALQIGMGLAQAGAGAFQFAQVVSAQGLAGALGMLKTETVKTAGKMKILGIATTGGIATMRGLPVDLSAFSGALGGAAKSTRRMFWVGPKMGVGAAGTIFGPIGKASLTFGNTLLVAAAGMVGWEIGQWLNSLGADELVYRGLRKLLGEGGETPAERQAATRRQEAASLAAQRRRRLLRAAERMAFAEGAKQKIGDVLAEQAPGPSVDVIMERTLAKTQGQVRRLRSAVAKGKVPTEFAGMGQREREQFRALVQDIQKGAYETVLPGVRESVGDIPKLLEAIDRLNGTVKETADKETTVNVDMDGRKLAKGLGRNAARTNARGGSGRQFSAAERNRILRSGVEVLRVAPGTV